VVAAVLALLSVACGSKASGGTSTGSGAAPGGSSGTQVTASLTEFHIALSQQTFPPGKYTFVVSNDGPR